MGFVQVVNNLEKYEEMFRENKNLTKLYATFFRC